MRSRPPQKIDVAENARKTPFVLILEITAEAPFQHEDVYFIFPRTYKRRNVKFAYSVRNLRKTDEAAVYIQIEAGIHALENEIRFFLRFAPPLEGAGKMIGRIFRRDMRRIEGERIAYVGILKIIIPEILHAGRYGDFLFSFLFPKSVGVEDALVGGDPPRSVQRKKPSACLSLVRPRRPLFKRHIVGPRRQYSHGLSFFVIFFQHIFRSFRPFSSCFYVRP